MTQLLVTMSFASLWSADGFVPASLKTHRSHLNTACETLPSSFGLRRRRRHRFFLYGKSFEDDDEDDDDDEDYIDTDSLGDWRNFRRSLAMGTNDDEGSSDSITSNEREVTDNEKVLEKQNKELAEEYAAGVWAHQTPTVSDTKAANALPFRSMWKIRAVFLFFLFLTRFLAVALPRFKQYSRKWVDWSYGCPSKWNCIAISGIRSRVPNFAKY
jgi:hypothetical protein